VARGSCGTGTPRRVRVWVDQLGGFRSGGSPNCSGELVDISFQLGRGQGLHRTISEAEWHVDAVPARCFVDDHVVFNVERTERGDARFRTPAYRPKNVWVYVGVHVPAAKVVHQKVPIDLNSAMSIMRVDDSLGAVASLCSW
jgi:hypothetical protein